jgi:acetyltransferase-like isoleucine patch superfamily enzyme
MAAGLTSPLRLRSVTAVGRRPRLRGVPVVRNAGRITIGDDFWLASFPLVSHLVTGRAGLLEIGNGVSIGAGAAISCEAHVRIGDRVRLGGSVMIMDTDFHDRRDFSAQAPAAPVVIEADARLGRNVTVLKGAHIGAGAWIGPGSVVSGLIPAGSCAAGVPARVSAGRDGPNAAAGADLLERVQTVVAATFAVEAPEPSDGPPQIPAWDSLGALRLLLALEEEFAVVLPDTLAEARSVLELGDAVAQRLREP